MHYDYQTEYTCSKVISFDLEGDVVRNVKYYGGCDGNLKAVPRLVEGLTVAQIEERLRGITCGRRPTSCGDQLARAVRAALDGTLQPQT